jgi:site-specific DNA-methyltransferase (adenine-specific)
MTGIDDHSIDMVLADLPYGSTQNQWDSIIPLAPLWLEYKRVIKRNGAIVLCAQIPFSIVLGASNLPWLRYEWIWRKTQGTGFLNANRYPLKNHENVLVFCAGSHTYNPQMTSGKPYTADRIRASTNYGFMDKETRTVNEGTRYPLTVLEFNHDKGSRKLKHPTQKPVALFEYLIETYTNPGELVLDNCVGSGTTCIAAINTERNYIGFETDPVYFNMAQERINTHERPATLPF